MRKGGGKRDESSDDTNSDHSERNPSQSEVNKWVMQISCLSRIIDSAIAVSHMFSPGQRIVDDVQRERLPQRLRNEETRRVKGADQHAHDDLSRRGETRE